MKLRILLFSLVLFWPFFHAQAQFSTITVTILSGQTASNAVAVVPQGSWKACTLGSLIITGAWTTADITFKVSITGVTYTDLYTSYNTPVLVTGGANRTIALSPATYWTVRWVQLISSAAQGADRTITLVCVPQG